MKNTLYTLPILMLLFSCQPDTGTKDETLTGELPETHEEAITEEQEGSPKTESIQVGEEIAEEKIADNERLYSRKFTEQLENGNGIGEIELGDGVMILNQKDSITFPNIPPMKQKKNFTGKKGNLTIALAIERINYSSIEYKLEIVDLGKSSKTTNGIADLNGYFFLGEESDLDELSGEYYFSTEYSNTVDSCYTRIRIGNVEDSNDAPLLVKMVKNCNGEVMDITLDNFPALREK